MKIQKVKEVEKMVSREEIQTLDKRIPGGKISNVQVLMMVMNEVNLTPLKMRGQGTRKMLRKEAMMKVITQTVTVGGPRVEKRSMVE